MCIKLFCNKHIFYNFSDQFKKIIKRYIKIRYNLDDMRQSACLVLNPFTVYSNGFLFNCIMVGQASDYMIFLPLGLVPDAYLYIWAHLG